MNPDATARRALYQRLANDELSAANARARVAVVSLVETLPGMSGCAYYANGCFRIDVLRCDTDWFDEFSVFAHELGHLLCEHVAPTTAENLTELLHAQDSALGWLRETSDVTRVILSEMEQAQVARENEAWKTAVHLLLRWRDAGWWQVVD